MRAATMLCCCALALAACGENLTPAPVASADPTLTVKLTVPQSQISLVGNVLGLTYGTVTATCSMRVEGQ